ncbi:DUF4091 domain-containing protein [Sphingobacterium sp. SGG-5]|uniref:DUF4091 domain-containing protein n=1 Tax=Sphingobacterium sp. SGG-5 TaxID=2710881 RepID=UPI0013EC3F36|nr:DUF4091 domain-containing protein [Sphingobacterium sp. SGG-5]NGM60709.1 DUF4091 domain-containing protein [Sphingobacterium sp. SGG-5]
MKTYFLLLFLLPLSISFAQVRELPDPKVAASDINTRKSAHAFTFIETEFSLSKYIPPTKAQIQQTWTGSGWKNETIHTQLAFAPNLQANTAGSVQLTVTPLRSGKNQIAADHIKFTPITFVMTDHPGDLKRGCGIKEVLDSFLVADRIETVASFAYSAGETRPLWLSIHIPEQAAAGTYRGEVIAEYSSGKTKQVYTLPYTVTVNEHTLPNPKDWHFHLDLWQNPYSSARYYNLTPFSDEHLAAIRPHYERLANAGQKTITTTLIYDPWNSQTYDVYDSMIKWVKTTDGDWKFDYADFDKWVRYMHDLGIQKFINCYSMIPWNLSFYYYDEASGKTQVFKAKPGTPEYEAHWLPFLKDFARHLKKNGWFDKTTIAMDERPMEAMLAAIKVIKKADKDFNISLAGTYHDELALELVDYCITLHEDMPETVLEQRKAKGYTTTMYTCCTEIFPNTFTNSGYSEAVWLGWNTVERDFDGYLRWAYDCWNAYPNQDTRFGKWLGGDTYLVYPNNTSSIRFEKLREGIQDVEKIRIIRQELTAQGRTAELHTLNQHIQQFSNKNINRKSIPKHVKSAKKFLNSLR